MERKNKRYYVLIVICCCGLAAAAIGLSMNCAGVFYAPVADSLAAGIGDVSLYLTIVSLASGFAGPYVVKLIQKYDLCPLMIAGVSVSSACFVALSRVTSVWHIYAIAPVLGVGNTFFGMVVISVIIGNWFAKRMGIMLGLALSFSGIVGAAMNPVINRIIEVFGWRNAYVCVGGLVFAIGLPAALILRISPEKVGLKPYGWREQSSEIEHDLPENTAFNNESNGTPSGKAVVLLCAVSAIGAFVAGLGSHMAGFAVSMGMSAQSGAYLTSMVMVGNTSSKLLAGMLCDVKGPRATAVLVFSLVSAGLVLLMLGSVEALWLMMLASILLGMTYCTSGTILSPMASQLFGSNFGLVYSYTSTCSFVSTAISTAAIGYSFDMTGSYTLSFVVCAVLSLLALVCVQAVYRVVNLKTMIG